MSHEITPSDNQLPDREGHLRRLAEQANEAHRRVADSLQQAVANALEVGHALLEAREICPDKKFTAWLKANFQGGLSTARGYMRLVANWNHLGGDLQRAGGLSQRQITKLLKGLPSSDGRANPRSLTSSRLPSPAGEQVECEGASGAEPVQKAAPPVAAGGDPLEHVGRLLEQAVAELRRLCQRGVAEASYARHLLQPLECICLGIPKRQWFWDINEA